ncbi:plastid division protein CDP1, chloroplastic isoform X2 [Punica granatum]|uniref:Plastid division protein CDP1, chloroplastic isoform X2 n=1 Tax=Punica granatum TaxID=22663 RepID=A0A6P8EK68_PUNGR|nr:plastid division protein CDP1, chloroplastic isoform X2 [Punica granatum]
MALPEASAAAATIPSRSCFCRSSFYYYHHCSSLHALQRLPRLAPSRIGVPRALIGLHSARRAARVRRWRSEAAAAAARTVESPEQARATTVEIPLTCYQLLGVPDQAEKDEIVKAVMQLKRSEIEEGYTMDAVKSREDLLMDVRDKLLFESEYAGNVKEKIPPKASLRIPWAWLPGALCLLQEVGEEKYVLDIGRAALQRPEAKPYVHDLLLSMALAECAIAKIGFEKNKVSQGFEALARAQCLLRSKISLGKMALLSQIEESLEELAPACTLELLGMPHSPENAERRQGAISALRELLRQGLDVESSCKVQDWPCFLSQALMRLMAIEIVDLLPWDDLAQIRKNKKSLESHNQRGVIDFSCFYMVLLAHIALGFSSKQTEWIGKARIICECLMASEGIDLKFEQAFCLFLLGQVNEAEAVEKLTQLELNSNSSPQKSVMGKEISNTAENNPSLEVWLKDSVLTVFPDTRDCSPLLVSFFTGEKRAPLSKKNKGTIQKAQGINHRPLSTAIASEGREYDGSLLLINPSQHLGSAVKQLTHIPNLGTAGKSINGSNVGMQSVQLERKLGAHHNNILGSLLDKKDVIGRITFATVLGCIVYATLGLVSKKLMRASGGSRWRSNIYKMDQSALVWPTDPCLDHEDTERLRSSSLAASISSSIVAGQRKRMPVEDAEALVKQWQAIKAEALGPTHQVQRLSDILDESMLIQWHALADSAKARSCYWRFVLLELSILRAEILSDGLGTEMAEVEALLEEAAELVDETQPKIPNYYSSYKTHYVLRRQEDGSWKFCMGDVQDP